MAPQPHRRLPRMFAMSKRHTMPLNVGDYLSDTAHLTTLEHGSYLLLIFYYWKTGSLPNDPRRLATIAKLSPTKWSRVKQSVLPFFQTGENGHLKHNRIEKEIERIKKTFSNAKMRGEMGAKARWNRQNNDASSMEQALFQNASSIPQAMLGDSNTDTVRKKEGKEGRKKERKQDAKRLTPNGVHDVNNLETGPEDSAEDIFWKLSEAASKSGISRSRWGLLAKTYGGDFEAAVVTAKLVLTAKAPSPYLGKIINSLQAEQKPRVRDESGGNLIDAPFNIFEMAAAGLSVKKLLDGRWKVGNEIYDRRGVLDGW